MMNMNTENRFTRGGHRIEPDFFMVSPSFDREFELISFRVMKTYKLRKELISSNLLFIYLLNPNLAVLIFFSLPFFR